MGSEYRCEICGEREADGSGWCGVCGRDYDRRAHNEGTVAEAMRWAAGRAVRFERRRAQRAANRMIADLAAERDALRAVVERAIRDIDERPRARAHEVHRTDVPSDAALRSFEQVWAEKVKQGYQYGHEALENVRFGWQLAEAERLRLAERVLFFCEEVEGERAHRERPKGGQQVSHHGDFSSAPPSTFSRLQWWARAFRAMLGV